MYEILKGLTDLPICILSIIFMILIYRKNKKSKSFYAFLFLSIASLGGILLHCFKVTEPFLSICWVIECILLMKVVLMFIFLILNKDIKKIFKILLIILIIPIILSRIFLPRLDIYFVTVYSSILLIYMLYIMYKEKIKIKNQKKIIIVLILTVISQIIKDLIPYGVVIGHILILSILYFIYLVIKDR